MKHLRGRLAILIAALCVSALTYHQGPYDVDIVAVTEDGRPVPNLRISQRWSKNQRDGSTSAHGGVVTDRDGKATLKLSGERWALLAFDASETLGGWATGGRETRKLRMVVRPLATLSTKVELDGWDGVLPRGFWTIAVDGGPEFGSELSGLFPQVADFKLPPGKYKVRIETMDTLPVTTPVDLSRGRSETLALKPPLTKIARNYGKPALPIVVSAQRNLAKPFKLDDYRGKWVYIMFWAYW